MAHPLLAHDAASSIPIWLVTDESWPRIAEGLPSASRNFATAQGFEAKAGTHCLLPNDDGSLSGVAFGLEGAGAKRADPFPPGKLPSLLPNGVYRLEADAGDMTAATLAWLLGAYSFERYRQRPAKAVRLVVPPGVDAEEVSRIAA